MFSAPPNVTDYTTFLRTVVGIPAGNLPDSADIIPTSLTVAQDIVNDMISIASPDLYVLAVYNLATDRLINYAPDVAGQTFFVDLRTKFRLLEVSVGVPSAAADQGTSTGILNPEFMKTMTLADLQTLRTPYGREYMGIALSVGTLWGVT